MNTKKILRETLKQDKMEMLNLTSCCCLPYSKDFSLEEGVRAFKFLEIWILLFHSSWYSIADYHSHLLNTFVQCLFLLSVLLGFKDMMAHMARLSFNQPAVLATLNAPLPYTVIAILTDCQLELKTNSGKQLHNSMVTYLNPC